MGILSHGLIGHRAALPDGLGQVAQGSDGRVPVDAAIGDGLAIGEGLALDQVLAAGDQVGFDHDADDPLVTCSKLGADIGEDQRLVFRVFGGIGVAGIDHQGRVESGLEGGLGSGIDTLGVEVRGFAAAQNDVAILFRETFIPGLREFLGNKTVVLPVTKLAKWKTTIQLVALGIVIAEPIVPGLGVVSDVVLWIAGIITLWTGWTYTRASWPHLSGIGK